MDETAGKWLRQRLSGIVGRVDRRMLFLGIAGAAVAFFLWIVSASWHQSPDLSGILTGLFVGLFATLLFLLLCVGAIAWIIVPERAPAAFDAALASELETLLGPTLAELEAVRIDVLRQIRDRAVFTVPVGVACAGAIWFACRFQDDPPGLFELVTWCGIGALAGYGWAGNALGATYCRLYKDRVLPRLAARFGELTYRQPQGVKVETLQERRLFATFDHMTADDEIAGTYRGLPLVITELALHHGTGDDRTQVFDGLLIELALPRTLVGTTVVTVDGGRLGTLRDLFRKGPLDRVRLEDPAFEARYEVHGTDQIAARALLTPAFIERFMALGDLAGFLPPVALAEDNRLTVALPKRFGKDLFQPPSYLRKAEAGRVLAELSHDIEAVLAVADSVIGLDAAARSASARSRAG